MELSSRERQLVLLAALLLVPLILLRLLVFPFLDYKAGLSLDIETRSREIVSIRKKGEEYLYYASLLGGNKAAPAQRVSQFLAQAGLKEQASLSSGAGGAGISISLDELTMAQAAGLIYRLESGPPPMMINNLELKASLQNPQRLQMKLVLEGP